MNLVHYPLVETNLVDLPRSGKISLLSASSGVLAADDRDSLIHRDQGLVVRIPQPHGAPFAYYFHGVPSRSSRPQHPETCPLCLNTVRASGQHYVAIDLPEWPILVLSNIFPYMPDSNTWVVSQHITQRCGPADANSQWHRVVLSMLRICEDLPGHVVGFNEVVGHSLDHLHLVSHRPPCGHGLYAPQQLACHLGLKAGISHLGPHNGYPTDVWRICGANRGEIADEALRLLAGWQEQVGPSISANCASVIEDGLLTLYVFVRNPLLTPWGWSGKPAILEMMGVFIASDAGAIERVRQGNWGHKHFSRVLSSLRTDLTN